MGFLHGEIRYEYSDLPISMPRFCRQGSSISSYYVCCQWQCHTKSRVESVQRKFTTYHYSCYITRSFWIFLLWVCCGLVYSLHSNDLHQCSILAADLLWNRKWTAYLYPSLTSCPCLDGLFIFCPIIKNNKVSCEYGILMWIIAVIQSPPGKKKLFLIFYIICFY